MLNRIKEFFNSHLLATEDDSKEDAEYRQKLAAAALLVELMTTDERLDLRELDVFMQILRETFALSEPAVKELSSMAKREAGEATSLYQFTRLINDHYDYEQKVMLIRNMWRVAYADEILDKYEESLIRSVADLIYVSHSDFIKAKLEVRPDPDNKSS